MAGERCSAFFVSQSQNTTGGLCLSSFPFPGPALPLHQLLHKLARSGQHKAVAALRGLSAPLPPDVRVRWRIYGMSLSVEVAS